VIPNAPPMIAHKQLGRKGFIEFRIISRMSGWIDHNPAKILVKTIKMLVTMKTTAVPFLLGPRPVRHGDVH
jgi:hypothetical protein